MVAVIDVAVTVPTTAAVPPKVTVAPAWKFVPVIVTTVPPAAGPDAGEMPTGDGGGAGGVTYAKPFKSVDDCPSGFVTTTLTVPAAWAGTVAEIDVAVTAPTTAAAPPNVTVAPVANPEPVRVTTVPPDVELFAGATEARSGGAT